MATQNNEGNELRKGPWSAEEDQILRNYVEKHGTVRWSSLHSQGLLSRSGKSCCSRWHDHLKHDDRRGGRFSAEEERKVVELQAQFGNKWAKISEYLPGRTKDDVKNNWRTRTKKLEREKNKHIIIPEPQTLDESLPLEVQSSSSSQLVEQSSAHMLDPSESLVEAGATDASLQFVSTSMPCQQEIEAESSLPCNATPNLTISDPQKLNESLPLEVQSSSSSQLVEQSSAHMLDPSEPLVEAGVTDASLQFASPSMPYQQEIEAESSLPCNATPNLTISDPQTLNESLPLEVQSSSSSQLVEQSSTHMLDPSEPLVEAGVTDASLQFASTSMPYQQEIEAESSLPCNATPNLTISDPQTLNESLPLEVQSSSSFPLEPQPQPQSYIYMQEEASESLFEADISSTSQQFKNTSMLNQQEIEEERCLLDNATTTDDFHDLPDKIDVDDNWIISSFSSSLPPSTRDDHDTTL